MLDQPMRGLLYKEAESILNRCTRTIQRWVKRGLIRSKKVSSTVYLNREDVEAIVKAEEFDESED